MSIFGQTSIRRRLVAVGVLTSGVALLLASVAFVIYEAAATRRASLDDLASLTAIVAETIAPALLFEDEQAVAEVVSSLAVNPMIVSVRVHDNVGELVASYRRAGVSLEPLDTALLPNAGLFDDRLYMTHDVVFDGQRLGRVEIEESLLSLRDRSQRSLTIVGVVFLAAAGVSFFLSAGLQRIILRPIERLAETAASVEATQNYSLRAPAGTEGEIGALVTNFNSMLEQIQQRDRALDAAREGLEEQVKLRTLELRVEVDEHRQTERELQRYAVELVRSNRDLEDFAYVASHDLQEPLRKIEAFGNQLQVRYEDSLDARGLDYLQRMRSAASRMRTLISDLLSFSRVATRAQPFEAVPLERLIRGVITDLELRIEEKSAEVTVGPLPTIEADPSQMRQLFQNLIHNGLKFKHPERPPRVSVRERDADDNTDGTQFAIEVEDNGIGIEAEHFERIFGVFQRLHTRAEFEGTGIGLSICRKIVERHGGRIEVESELGLGSRFVVFLPRTQSKKGVAT